VEQKASWVLCCPKGFADGTDGHLKDTKEVTLAITDLVRVHDDVLARLTWFPLTKYGCERVSSESISPQISKPATQRLRRT
jgi:hypothetical protein